MLPVNAVIKAKSALDTTKTPGVVVPREVLETLVSAASLGVDMQEVMDSLERIESVMGCRGEDNFYRDVARLLNSGRYRTSHDILCELKMDMSQTAFSLRMKNHPWFESLKGKGYKLTQQGYDALKEVA